MLIITEKFIFWAYSAIVLSMEKSTFKRININGLLKQTSPKIAPFIPKPVIRYLERLLHIEEINDFIESNYNDQPLEFVNKCIKYLNFNVVVENQERLNYIAAKRAIIVSNHPLGGTESLIMLDALKARNENLLMISQGIMEHIKPLWPLLISIPTEKNRKEIEDFREAFDTDKTIIMFPAGYCSRVLSNKVFFDYQWHPTFVKMAKRYNRCIIPIHISGQNSKKFYRLSALRRALKIKTSLETIYLPDEMFKQANSTVTLTVGDVIEAETLSEGSLSAFNISDRIRNYVYKLGLDKEVKFNLSDKAVLPLK